MRKLLILAVVLGMASMANAGLSLVVGGVESGAEITLNATDSIWIGIYDDTGSTQFDAVVTIAEESLGVPEAGGSWTGGNNVYSPPAIPGAYNSPWGPTPYGNVWYLVGSAPITNMPGIGLQSDYEFHCDIPGDDVVINLLASDLVTVLDTLTIHQIPEPITIALLGLGGLFLRRRK